MDFGENALKNKVQPFIANAPSFSNALSNSKDVPSLYKMMKYLKKKKDGLIKQNFL